MPEYYVVLKKAVGGADSGSADGRRAVYDKARNALISQLKAIDPPLASSEISRQRLELEEAIRRVERETASEARDVRRLRPRESEIAPSAAPDSAPSPAPEPSELTPQDLFRQAIQQAEKRTNGSPTLRDRTRTSGQFDDRDREVAPPGNWAQDGPPEYQIEDNEENTAGRAVPERDDARQSREPALTMTPDPHLDRRDLPPQGVHTHEDHDEGRGDPLSAPVARRSRLPTIMLFILIVGMIGGLGALAYSQRTLIAELLSDFDSGTPQETNLSEAVSSAPSVVVPKSDDRVPGGSEGERDAIADAITGAPEFSAGVSGASGNALTAQKATLYEESPNTGSGTSGNTAFDARVSWRLLESGPGGPEIEANLEIPDRGMNVRLVIGRNTDPNLPASHMVVATIESPADFPGKGISRVPGVIMKVGEDGSGQPLVGETAKISGNLFWVALSSAEPDVERNLLLLRDRSWIDVPLVYETGQRAILTFEKGASGENVFSQALAAWAAG